MTRRRILVRAPELTLKGRNQKDFLRTLKRNVAHVLRRGGIRCQLSSARGRLYVDLVDPTAEGHACRQLALTPGVDSLIPGVFLPPKDYLHEGRLERGAMEASILELARREEPEGRSFAVKVNRLDKTFPLESEEIGAWLGDVVRSATDWQTVDLSSPSKTFRLDIFPDGSFISECVLAGLGGLPVGSSDAVLSLLSGGIDSPVASALMAKRGCVVDFLHMSVQHPGTIDIESYSVCRLAARLSRITQRSRLLVVPYGPLELATTRQTTRWNLLLFRRFLVKLGERLAEAESMPAKALVTGDSLGQVSSQTLDNLISSSRAARIEVLRPLIGLNKQEIISIARRIETYDVSIEPHKDCCALFEEEPATRSRAGRLHDLERELYESPEALVERTLAEGRCLVYGAGRLVEETPIDEVLGGARSS